MFDPQNPQHQKALILHKLADYGVEFLVLYSKPDEISDYYFRKTMEKAMASPEVISILPEEIQIKALTLL